MREDVPKKKGPPTVRIISSMGFERDVTLRELAEKVLESIYETDSSAVAELLARAELPESKTSSTILLTTRRCLQAQGHVGSVQCPVCGKFVSAATQGLEWHLKTAHGGDASVDGDGGAGRSYDHAMAAYTANAAARLALVPSIGLRGASPDSDGST